MISQLLNHQLAGQLKAYLYLYLNLDELVCRGSDIHGFSLYNVSIKIFVLSFCSLALILHCIELRFDNRYIFSLIKRIYNYTYNDYIAGLYS